MTDRFVIMGVAGSGKSHIGVALADRIGAEYLDGDDLHPPANIEKMSRGDPLTDEDRWPWLDLVGDALANSTSDTIIGCSALKRTYRDRIRAKSPSAVFLYLHGDRELIETRMAARDGHFMPVSLLDSQFSTLEVPGADERHVKVDIDGTPEMVVDALATGLDRFDAIP